MRILLIQPPSSLDFIDRVFMHEPLALEYLGAGLKLDGHDILLLDGRIEDDVVKVGVDFQPDIVAITGYTSQVNIIKELAEEFKILSPPPFVVVGGHHATVCPTDFNVSSIDLVVIGEGVTSIREIVVELSAQQNFIAIDGIGIPGDTMQFSRSPVLTAT